MATKGVERIELPGGAWWEVRAVITRGMRRAFRKAAMSMLSDVGSDVDLTDSDSIKAYVTAHPSAWDIDGVENAHLTMGSVAWSFDGEITLEAIDALDDELVAPVLARMSELYSEPDDEEIKN
jgi:hypothetical protein